MIMRKITVNASKTYDVIIEKGSLDRVGEFAKEVNLSGKACIISDSNVAPLYFDRVKNSLEKSGFSVISYVFPAGEKSKNAKVYIEILNFLAENNLSRKDTLFALGGGVTGDLTGFCAATYMRGINFVQIPTSLLACVDSSVGGKTGIDLECGKNLAGAFYQPRAVIFDPKVLSTLPEDYFSDGMAEIIKYAMIRGKGIDKLLLEDADTNLEEIITRCVEIKRDIVAEDEFEGGIRKILNFGHTAGHAIEAEADFSLSHGRCVAVGMYIVTKAWEKRGLCRKGTCDILKQMLDKHNLKTSCPYSPEVLSERAKNDKKASGGFVDLIVPDSLGECHSEKITMDEFLLVLKEGME